MGTDDDPTRVDGHTFWRADIAGTPVELTTTTAIEVDERGIRWHVAPPSERRSGETIGSESREVAQYMRRVLGGMQRAKLRAARRAIVRQPVPKPTPKPPAPVPATAPVACPLCRGEAWPDCELCDGDGVISARQAAAWTDHHS